MRYILKLIAFSGMIALPIAATTQAQETTIRVSATPSILAAMFETLVADFEAAHPDIDVELEIPAGEQDEHIQTLLRQAIVGDVPDVTFQSYNFIRVLADRGVAVNLTPFIDSDPEWTEERYSASVVNMGLVNGEPFALGGGVSFPVIYYNADLVAAAQDGNGTMPTDWNGIVELAQAIGELEGNVVGGYHRFHPWFFQAHINSRGGAMMTAGEADIAFDGPEGLAGFQVGQAFGKAGQAASAMTREQARQAFVGGTIGLFTDSSGLLNRHIEQIGDRFELGVVRWPILAENGGVPGSGVSVMMTATEEPQQAAAWAFMRFVASAQGQEAIVLNSSYVPVNGAAVEQSERLQAYFADNPLMGVALETSEDAVAWHAFPGANSQRIDGEIFDTQQAVVTLEAEPQQALKALAAFARDNL